MELLNRWTKGVGIQFIADANRQLGTRPHQVMGQATGGGIVEGQTVWAAIYQHDSLTILGPVTIWKLRFSFSKEYSLGINFTLSISSTQG